MKLLSGPISPFSRKVRIVLAEKKIDCEIETVDVTPADNPANAYNPLGKIPTLLLDDGTPVYDSRVIVEFLDSASPISRLIPDDKRERVAVRRWEALADGILDAGILIRYEGLRPKKEQSAKWREKQMARMERGLAAMAGELGEKAWCQGERFTLADIAAGCTLGWIAFRFPQIDWRGKYPNLARHFDKLSERASFVETNPK